MFAQSTVLLALAASVSGHIIMSNPVPFAWEDTSTKQSPLEPADFPCKQPQGTYAITTMNQWNAGESQAVKLIGGATHRGGTCQFSISTDTKPTKESQWKVIHTVVGGCPNEFDGNLSNNPDDEGNPAVNVTMPADMPDGQYTFAWTWMNKDGNREFYMNCAPIQVGEASTEATATTEDVSAALASKPDMFVINLPSDSCASGQNVDLLPPDLGDSVETRGSGASAALETTGPGCASMVAMGAGAGSLGAPAQATGGSAGTSSAAGGVFAPGASSPPAATQSATTPVAEAPATQPAATQPAVPTTTGASAPAGTGTPSNSSGDDCAPCDTDGAVVCIGTTQFGLCNRGCAVPQALAGGMSCTNGVMSASTRRSIRFSPAHLHRRHGSGLH